MTLQFAGSTPSREAAYKRRSGRAAALDNITAAENVKLACKTSGILAKTDTLDAQVIARFGFVAVADDRRRDLRKPEKDKGMPPMPGGGMGGTDY